jgi:folate-binding protein YgfZ
MLDLKTAEQLALEDVVAVTAERDLLSVSGPDAGTYLHGQLSQDVTGLAAGQTTWTLLLQPQGKVDAWLRIHRLADDGFLLDVEPGFGQLALDRLKRFMLRVDMEIELQTVTVLALRGPGSVSAAETAVDGVLTLDASWAGSNGIDLLLPGHTESDLANPVLSNWLSADVPVGPAELLEVLRVTEGRPAMGSELDESTIPAAARIVDASVDFTKGCYVGQELVARVDSRGNNTPTRLYGLRFDGGDAPAPGTELLADGSAAGVVTSVAVSPANGAIGLGYLKRAVEVSAELQVIGSDGAPITVAAVELPAG